MSLSCPACWARPVQPWHNPCSAGSNMLEIAPAATASGPAHSSQRPAWAGGICSSAGEPSASPPSPCMAPLSLSNPAMLHAVTIPCISCLAASHARWAQHSACSTSHNMLGRCSHLGLSSSATAQLCGLKCAAMPSFVHSKPLSRGSPRAFSACAHPLTQHLRSGVTEALSVSLAASLCMGRQPTQTQTCCRTSLLVIEGMQHHQAVRTLHA
jgi:hypothetical protein